MKPSQDIRTLIEIMEALRHRENGCPWDIEQTFQTIVPYTIEEAYEVADAIERNDRVDLCEELGDLLLQVVYHARIAEEEGSFSFDDVVNAITTKMIRRHPHVFGDKKYRDVGMVNEVWTKIKQEEKEERRLKRQKHGLVDDTPKGHLGKVKTALPVTKEAIELQKKAAEVGFDWTTAEPIFDKITEELAELAEAVKADNNADMKAEFGDLYFALINLARRLDIDPEKALAQTNKKFRTRFAFIEKKLTERGDTLDEASLEEMENLWQKAKEEK